MKDMIVGGSLFVLLVVGIIWACVYDERSRRDCRMEMAATHSVAEAALICK